MKTTDTIKALRDALTEIQRFTDSPAVHAIAKKALGLTADASEDAPRQITYCEEEWITKTDWVQTDFQKDLFPLAYLGQHRADIMRDEIARLRMVIAHSVPVAKQPTSQPDGAQNNVRPAPVGAVQAPDEYPPATKIISVPLDSLQIIYAAMNHMGDVLNEMDVVDADDEKVFPAFDLIRDLMAKPAPAAPAQQAAPAPEECESNQGLGNGRADLSPPQVARVAHAKPAQREQCAQAALNIGLFGKAHVDYLWLFWQAAQDAKPEPVEHANLADGASEREACAAAWAIESGGKDFDSLGYRYWMGWQAKGRQAGAVDGDVKLPQASTTGFDCGCQVNDAGELVLCGPCEVELSASAEDAVDVKRYRYLRDAIPSHMRMWVAMGIPGQGCSWWHGEKLDARVDLEIAQKGK